MSKQSPSTEERLDGSGLRLRIVAAKYNLDIVDALLAGAVQALREHGVSDTDIGIVRVPGAFEIPLALSKGAGGYDAQIALGCVIRGETAHFDQVVAQCARGIMDTMLSQGVPIAFGVLAVENILQARERAGDTANRGEEAALAALEAAELMKQLDSRG